LVTGHAYNVLDNKIALGRVYVTTHARMAKETYSRRVLIRSWNRPREEILVEVEGGNGVPRRNLKVVQKLAALRPVYEIYDEETGELLAVARQTWMSFLRSTVHMEDPDGHRILTAKGGFFYKTFLLYDEQGQVVAKITRPWIAFRKSFTIQYRDDLIKAQGGFMAWGFDAYNSAGQFAFRLDKKVLAIRDQFRVTVGDYMDWKHAVASAIVVDRIFFEGQSSGCRYICCLIVLAFIGLSLLLMMAGLI